MDSTEQNMTQSIRRPTLIGLKRLIWTLVPFHIAIGLLDNMESCQSKHY